MNKVCLVDEYIKSQPDEAALMLKAIRDCIYSVEPDAEALINYNLPAFALIKGGKRDKQIMIGANKNHIGFYPSPEVIEHFEEELKPYKTSKGAVQFKISEPFPKDLIVEMVQYKKSLI